MNVTSLIVTWTQAYWMQFGIRSWITQVIELYATARSVAYREDSRASRKYHRIVKRAGKERSKSVLSARSLRHRALSSGTEQCEKEFECFQTRENSPFEIGKTDAGLAACSQLSNKQAFLSRRGDDRKEILGPKDPINTPGPRILIDVWGVLGSIQIFHFVVVVQLLLTTVTEMTSVENSVIYRARERNVQQTGK